MTQSVAPNWRRQLELVRVDVDRDDALGLGHDGALDHATADAAEAEDRHGGAGFDLGGVEHRADAGGDAAAEQADLVQRRVLGLILASEISGTTVYSEKVDVPM